MALWRKLLCIRRAEPLRRCKTFRCTGSVLHGRRILGDEMSYEDTRQTLQKWNQSLELEQSGSETRSLAQFVLALAQQDERLLECFFEAVQTESHSLHDGSLSILRHYAQLQDGRLLSLFTSAMLEDGKEPNFDDVLRELGRNKAQRKKDPKRARGYQVKLTNDERILYELRMKEFALQRRLAEKLIVVFAAQGLEAFVPQLLWIVGESNHYLRHVATGALLRFRADLVEPQLRELLAKLPNRSAAAVRINGILAERRSLG